MPILSAKGLTKAYGEKVLLSDASFTIRKGERIGLVGRNGTGKSTLARMVAGSIPPDGGEVMLRKGAGVRYLDQAPLFDAHKTPRQLVEEGLSLWQHFKLRYEELGKRLAEGPGVEAELAHAAAEIERLGGWDRSHEVEAMLGHLGISRIDDPVGPMSGGEKRRVALSQILVARPDLAILDEPTNHLDVVTIDWLEQFLSQEYRGAILLVTHDRYLLDRLCTRTLELEHGIVYDYSGGYETYLEAKAERLAHEARTEQNRQNFLRRELQWLSRQPKARTTKQKARIERAEEARLSEPAPEEKNVVLQVTESRLGGTVLVLERVSVSVAGRELIRDLTLSLLAGERVGILGPNGAGKTSLLRAIVGEIPSEGRITLGKNTRPATLDQGRENLASDQSIFDNIADQGHIEAFGELLDPRSYLERFLFEPKDQKVKVGALSGGERARVALAKALRTPANLLLLDEPTNDLDVATLSALEEMLLMFRGAALIVTHDRAFLDRVATSLLVFEASGRVVRYPGNYETYRRLVAQQVERPSEAVREPLSKSGAERPREPRRGLTFAERLELEKLPEAIERAEKAVRESELSASDPALYRDKDASREALAHLETAKAHAQALLERWEVLERKNEG